LPSAAKKIGAESPVCIFRFRVAEAKNTDAPEFRIEENYK
jgi:hypothetical protein